MNVSAWSIRNPVPGILVFAMLTVLGLIGFHRLQIQNFPDLDVPTIVIAATLEGAAPEQLETEVARKIEDKLTSLTKLDHVTTTITDGSVSISVAFQLEKDNESALSEVRNAVDSARADLPASMAAPVVSKNTAAASALLTYTAASTLLDEQDLSWFVDNDLAKALLAVKGVSTVKRVGGVDREVHIDLIPALMAGLGVTPATVSAQLKAAQLDSSGGQGDIAGQRQSARTLGGVKDAEQIAAMTIALGDGRSVRLDQIARISDTHAERTSLAFRDGKPVIGVQVTRSLGYSDVSVAREVRAALATFAAPTRKRRSPRRATPSSRSKTTTAARWSCCSKAHCSRWPWCGGSCATYGQRCSPRSRCRCRSSRPSARSTCSVSRSTRSRCSRWRS